VAEEWLQSKFSVSEWQYFHKALHSRECIPSSSMGRLFDAVASLLGLCDFATYEGEAALYLEAAAHRGRTTLPSWGPLSTPEEYMERVVHGLQNKIPVERIAFQFHCSLVGWIEHVAREHGLKRIAFSGGVFQNALLVDLIQERLASFSLFFHTNLSPNDECISVGQLACHQLGMKKVTVRKEAVHINT
jgi:hydrogenase maturation protein HypF